MSRQLTGGLLFVLAAAFAFEGISASLGKPDLPANGRGHRVASAEPMTDASPCGTASNCPVYSMEDIVAVADETEAASDSAAEIEQVSFQFAEEVPASAAADRFPVPSYEKPKTASLAPPTTKSQPAGRQNSTNDPSASDFNPFDQAKRSTEPEEVAEAEADEKYLERVWIVLHPENGLKFLQQPEELAVLRRNNPGTQWIFLLDCATFSMEGQSGEKQPDFVLTCEGINLQGSYGTEKQLSLQGAKLSYETESRVLKVTGTEDAPVQLDIRDADQMKIQAQEITLQLQDAGYQIEVSGAQLELIAEPNRKNSGDAPLFDVILDN